MNDERPHAEFHAEAIFAHVNESDTFAHLTLVNTKQALAVSLPFSALATLRDRIDALLAQRR
jgi:hypothetical protein